MDSREMKVGNWIVRVREPAWVGARGEALHPVVGLIHGWTGDEKAMWIFANRLPKNCMLIAPRGLYPTRQGGYGWQEEVRNSWPTVNDFRPALTALEGLFRPENFPEADFSRLWLLGFSQGAALSYTFALLYPERVQALAGLAGFTPDDAERPAASRPLLGKPAFVAHGRRDETVPVARARQAVEVLEQAGAVVTYCEDDVGHKLSLNCFQGLEAFFKRIR